MCSKCGQKRSARNQARSVAPSASVARAATKNTLFEKDFTLVTYVGETGVLKSVVPNIGYGYRSKDARFWVHNEDIKANPELYKVD